MRITADQILAHQPCDGYDRARIESLLGGPSIAVSDCLPVLLALSPSDARWVVSRLLPHRDRVSWACDCAERVVDRIDDECQEGVALAAIQTARAWVEGEATTARPAAAAYAAAAARSAAATAYADYNYSDDVADYAAARSAAAGDCGEHEWQLERALVYLGGEE